jgi:hypothetical protein
MCEILHTEVRVADSIATCTQTLKSQPDLGFHVETKVSDDRRFAFVIVFLERDFKKMPVFTLQLHEGWSVIPTQRWKPSESEWQRGPEIEAPDLRSALTECGDVTKVSHDRSEGWMLYHIYSTWCTNALEYDLDPDAYQEAHETEEEMEDI